MSSPIANPRFHPTLTIPKAPDAAAFDHAAIAPIDQYHPGGSDHRPATIARIFWSDDGIHIRFDVQDRYVIATRIGYLSQVWKDSCVEFFVQPVADKGYFNFEINALGSLLLYYIEDCQRNADGTLAKYQPVPEELGKTVQISTSIKAPITAEITDRYDWSVNVFIPFAVFEPFVGPLAPIAGSTWRGNFQKCADDCSHPHWGAWANIGEALNFHQPKQFGTLIFGK